MEKVTGIGMMNRPFPAGSALSVWFDKWIESVKANENLTYAKNTFKLQTHLANLRNTKSENTNRWTRLVKRLVVVIQRLPFIIAAKFRNMALVIEQSFKQEVLLAKNLNTQNA